MIARLPPPSKHEIMRTTQGKYTWWPELQLVDYTPKGKNKYTTIAHLSVKKNTEKEALFAATKHLLVLIMKD